MGNSVRLYFFLWGGGSKITANGDYSHEIKKHILLKRKVMTNLDSILEKEMATHSSVFAWRIPGMREPGGLPSMGLHRVGHNWSDLAAAAADSILKSRDITLPTKVGLVKAMVFPVVMYVCEVGLWRKLSAKELMLLNCGIGEDSWESLGLQGDPASPS